MYLFLYALDAGQLQIAQIPCQNGGHGRRKVIDPPVFDAQCEISPRGNDQLAERPLRDRCERRLCRFFPPRRNAVKEAVNARRDKAAQRPREYRFQALVCVRALTAPPCFSRLQYLRNGNAVQRKRAQRPRRKVLNAILNGGQRGLGGGLNLRPRRNVEIKRQRLVFVAPFQNLVDQVDCVIEENAADIGKGARQHFNACVDGFIAEKRRDLIQKWNQRILERLADVLEKLFRSRDQLIDDILPFVALACRLPDDVGLIVYFIDDVEHEHLFLRFGELLPFLPVDLHRF